MRSKEKLVLGFFAVLVWCFLGAQSAWAASFTITPGTYDYGTVVIDPFDGIEKEFTLTNTATVSQRIIFCPDNYSYQEILDENDKGEMVCYNGMTDTPYSVVLHTDRANNCQDFDPILTPGQSCIISYEFKPTDPGTFNENQNLRSEDGLNTATIPLYGKADTTAITTSVYRFWSASLRGHFFTASAVEKDDVIANKSTVWSYEGEAWRAYANRPASAAPVYRFWSNVYGHHFYTISETEKDEVIAKYSANGIWTYENIAYYAYPNQTGLTIPVYRFYSPVFAGHFFTTSEVEKNDIITNKADVWTYEGIAFYVLAS